MTYLFNSKMSSRKRYGIVKFNYQLGKAMDEVIKKKLEKQQSKAFQAKTV